VNTPAAAVADVSQTISRKASILRQWLFVEIERIDAKVSQPRQEDNPRAIGQCRGSARRQFFQLVEPRFSMSNFSMFRPPDERICPMPPVCSPAAKYPGSFTGG
jgi:hypothetical protein